MNNTLIQILAAWQDWGAFAGLVVALLVVFWVFYDAPQKGKEATLWKVLTVVPPILIIPSVILRLASQQLASMANAVEPLSYLGMGSVVVSVLSFAGYLFGRGTEERRCPTCGRTMQPGWGHCPYCVQQQPQPVQTVTQSPAPPPPPPAPSALTRPMTGPVMPVGGVASPPAQATQVIRQRPTVLAWLVPQEGVHAGQPFPLNTATTIGRDGMRSDIVLDDPTVSQEHAKVRLQEGEQFTITDLASANSTFVRNRETGEWKEAVKHILQDHDEIKVGETVFTFMQVAKTVEE